MDLPMLDPGWLLTLFFFLLIKGSLDWLAPVSCFSLCEVSTDGPRIRSIGFTGKPFWITAFDMFQLFPVKCPLNPTNPLFQVCILVALGPTVDLGVLGAMVRLYVPRP